jgi:antirestriction protein ArdC
MARDIYAEVTDKIIAKIEAGALPWVKPWSNAEGCNSGLPVNYSTGKAYRGINVLMLWASGFPDQRWLTYKLKPSAPTSARVSMGRSLCSTKNGT